MNTMGQGMDSCGNGCGLIAAFIGCIGFGSFGAPLKSEAVNMVNPDPFVLQTYKSAMSFLTCWFVLFLGVDFNFSPWGILSGLMWVSGGVCGIFGIRNAGLAISVGTWSSITVLASFAWGIFVFDEQVQSIRGTAIGVLLLLFGFVGMTYFSLGEDEDRDAESSLTDPLLESSDEEVCTRDEHTGTESTDPVVEASAIEGETEQTVMNTIPTEKKEDGSSIMFLGLKCDKKVLGILGAAVDGILGGSNLIPMKLAPSIDRGLDYVISFAIGAAIATIGGWLLYFLINSYKKESFRDGYQTLPSLYLDKILLPGVLSGTLWSIGNVSQILSVTFLGESIGMSIVQSQMIISGLIGIVVYEEIKDTKNMIYWGFSALVTFAGIICLSQEHKS